MGLGEARNIMGLGNAQRLTRRPYSSPENIRHNEGYVAFSRMAFMRLSIELHHTVSNTRC
jgi:hypothetical protein